MKRFLYGVLFIILANSVFAGGLYLDVGMGVGAATTKINGSDVTSGANSLYDIGVDLSMKAGYGPVANTPIYLALSMDGLGHRLVNEFGYIQFNSYILGGGIVIYPIKNLQIAASGGYSFTANDSSANVIFYESKSGYGGNISVALDIGGARNGALIGIKYSMTNNTLENNAEQETSMITVFGKYTYRHRRTK